MGGTGAATEEREAVSALRWWLEVGVDCTVQESARNWLETERAANTFAPGQSVPRPVEIPNSLEAFREWVSTSPDAPLASAKSRPVLPQGAQDAEVMLLSEPPTRDDLASGQPIGGQAAELVERMLRAVGLAGLAYSANIACFHSPTPRMSGDELEKCADVARRHIALVRPKRLLLLGDAPSRVLLGKPLLDARGHVHKVDGVRTIATFHPRQLLKRSSDKALAWKDILLLTEDLQ